MDRTTWFAALASLAFVTGSATATQGEECPDAQFLPTLREDPLAVGWAAYDVTLTGTNSRLGVEVHVVAAPPVRAVLLMVWVLEDGELRTLGEGLMGTGSPAAFLSAGEGFALERPAGGFCGTIALYDSFPPGEHRIVVAIGTVGGVAIDGSLRLAGGPASAVTRAEGGDVRTTILHLADGSNGQAAGVHEVSDVEVGRGVEFHASAERALHGFFRVHGTPLGARTPSGLPARAGFSLSDSPSHASLSYEGPDRSMHGEPSYRFYALPPGRHSFIVDEAVGGSAVLALMEAEIPGVPVGRVTPGLRTLDVATDRDANGKGAVSTSGSARAEWLAVSGTGRDADGAVAVAIVGDATGAFAVSGAGDARGVWLGASAAGRAEGAVRASACEDVHSAACA